MKNISVFFLFLVALISCDNRNCDDVICGQNQVCNNGICLCQSGYEGKDCQTLAYEKYVGGYNIAKSCAEGNGAFVSFGTIQQDVNTPNKLLFYNFLNLGLTAYAYIQTDQNNQGNFLQFPNQNLGASQIVGEGRYQSLGGAGRIVIEIQSTINNQLSACTYTYY